MEKPKPPNIRIVRESDGTFDVCKLCGSSYHIEKFGAFGLFRRKSENCIQPKCENAHPDVSDVYDRFSFLFQKNN